MKTALLVLGISVATLGVCAPFLLEQREYRKAFEPVVIPVSTHREGTATWCARGLPNPEAMTCASREYPRGTTLVVESNCRVVVVKVNDTGPEAWTGHLLDLSRGAFHQLAPLSTGVIPIRVQEVRP